METIKREPKRKSGLKNAKMTLKSQQRILMTAAVKQSYQKVPGQETKE